MKSKLNLPEGRKFGYLDTETTGTSSNDQVIEVSLISDDGSILFNTLIKPTVAVNPFAYKVHKISNDELKNAPSWADVSDQFNKIASDLDAIFIYNEPFDRRILSQSYSAYGLKMPSFNLVCAHKIAKSWMQKNGFSIAKSNLDLFCKISGASLDGVNRHRALGDCILMKRAFDAIESGSSIGLNNESSIGVFSNNTNSSSVSVDARIHIKEVIDNVFYKGIQFDNYVNLLRDSGISVIPVLGDDEDAVFNACYYCYNQSQYTGSKIGKNYSAPNMIKNGLVFNKEVHGDLLRKLFFKGKLNEQKSTFLDIGKSVLGDDYNALMNLTWPVRSFYKIKQRSRVLGNRVDAFFSSSDTSEGSQHRGQYSIDTEIPKSIRIRELSFNNVSIKFEYSNHLDQTPFSVFVTLNGETTETSGEKCVSRAIHSLGPDISNIASNYFKNNLESEAYSIDQDLFCGFEDKIIASIPRFADTITVNQCSIYPVLKSLKQKNNDYDHEFIF